MGTIYRNGTAFIGSGGAGGVELTQAEYDALPETEKMNGSIYFISDGEASYPSASTMRYDNSTSGLTATSVQAAVDEVNEKVNDNAWDISELNADLALETKTYGTRGVTVYRIGRLRVLRVAEPNGMSHSQNAWTTYATLDEKDIPVDIIDASIINNTAGQQTATPLQLRISSAGVVQVYNFTLSSLQAFGIVTYISKN